MTPDTLAAVPSPDVRLDPMYSFLVAALDAISVGVIAVDRNMRLMHSNAYAREILQQGSCLGLVGGQLTCPQAADAARLRLAVGHCLGGTAATPEVFRLYDHRLAEFLEIATLRCAAPGEAEPFAAIYLRSPDPQQAVSDTLLAELYGLTRAERQIAFLLTQQGSVTLAAKVRGVSPSTARTHLRSLLRKTGARRQVDLVQRLSTGLGGMIRLGLAAAGSARTDASAGRHPASIEDSKI